MYQLFQDISKKLSLLQKLGKEKFDLAAQAYQSVVDTDEFKSCDKSATKEPCSIYFYPADDNYPTDQISFDLFLNAGGIGLKPCYLYFEWVEKEWVRVLSPHFSKNNKKDHVVYSRYSY